MAFKYDRLVLIRVEEVTIDYLMNLSGSLLIYFTHKAWKAVYMKTLIGWLMTISKGDIDDTHKRAQTNSILCV